MDRERRQAFAKKHSPGYAVERYAKGPMKKLPPPEKKANVPSVDRATEKKVKKFEELAETVKEVGSTFGIRKREIMDAVATGNIDHAVLQFQRQAYSTIVNLIPIAEKAYKKHQREHQAYVLNSLISQGRELASDLMASGDRAQLAEIIAREVLEPVFKSMLQQFMQEQLQLKTILGDKIKPQFSADASREMDNSLKRMAQVMNDMYKSTTQQINRKLLGD
jgi:hypothetical protein